MRRIVLLFILTGLAGCSSELHVSPPSAPKNLSATFRIDIFGGEHVNLQWEDTNWSDDIGFTVHRNGAEIAVVAPDCLAWDDIVCTDFRMYTSYYDYNVSRGETYCYAVSAHYYGVVDASIFGDSDLSTETCITIPLEGSDRLP
jgi:hypothetical protein